MRLLGRADYLIWDNDGGLSGFLNIRGPSEGQPVWISQGPAKSIAGGLAPWENVRLADVNGDGKVDYCIINQTTGAVELYLNAGTADTSVVGDGVRFADLDGNGLDDYIFLDENGKMTAYLNAGPDAAAGQGPVWLPQNNGNPIASGGGSKRQDIRLADINGDGKADYLKVDPVSGAVDWYLNGGANAAAGGWLWIPMPQLAAGIGDGAGVRFADIDGDGRADYIWLSKSGATTVYLNKAGILIPLNGGNPIAAGVGANRQDIRFADINGDGKADYVWVHPADGSVEVWINQISTNPAYWYQLPGTVAGGVGFSGRCIEFAYLDHTGRADYIPVVPSSGAITAYVNGCNDPIAGSGTGGSGSGGSGSGGSGSGGSCSGGSGSGGSGIVYIDPSIWHTANPVVQCQPPCTLVLPPFPLPSVETITWPPFTTSVLSSTNGVTVTKTTVFTIPVFSTSEIDFWPVIVGSTDPSVATITAEQSVMPPRFTITLPGTEASIQVTESGSSSTTTTLVPPIWFGSSHVVTFQPYPTVSIPVPPPGAGPSPITYSIGPPKPTGDCTSGCGSINCDFGCPGGSLCGLFGCSGGCGLFGCSGGCGLFGCGGSGGGGGGGGNGRPTTSCTDPKTVGSACSVNCPQTVVPWTTVTSSCTTTCTFTSSSCGATDSTTTSNTITTITYPASATGIVDPAYTEDLGSFEATMVYGIMQSYLAAEDSAATALIPCTSQDMDPGLNILTAYCVCSSSTFPVSVNTATTPFNSCAYTSLPTSTINPIASISATTSNCQACSLVGGSNSCQTVTGCTPTPTPTPAVAKSVIIGLRNIGLSSQGGVGASQAFWDLYDAASNKFDACATALYEQGISSSTVPTRPTNLGPFSLTGPQNCYYKAPDSNTVGAVSCNNGVTIPCSVTPPTGGANGIFFTCTPPALAAYDSFLQQIYCNYVTF